MPWKYSPQSTDGSHETFDIPKQDPKDAYSSSAAAWPSTSMTSTSPEDVYARAQAEQQQEQGAADAQPRVMDFYNGVTFAQGRAAHNASLIARGLSPIPEGRK